MFNDPAAYAGISYKDMYKEGKGCAPYFGQAYRIWRSYEQSWRKGDRTILIEENGKSLTWLDLGIIYTRRTLRYPNTPLNRLTRESMSVISLAGAGVTRRLDRPCKISIFSYLNSNSGGRS